MGNRRGVRDLGYADACGLDGADGALAAGARSLHADFALVHALRDRDAGRVLRDHRGGKRGGLAAALEARLAGRAPGDHAAARVGDRNLRVVESGADKRDSRGNRLTALLGLGLALRRGSRGVCGRSGRRQKDKNIIQEEMKTWQR